MTRKFTANSTSGRSRDRITPAMEDRAVALARDWPNAWGDMTATAFAKRVGETLNIRCTRQGLLKRRAIAAAFDASVSAKAAGKPRLKRPNETEALLARVRAKDEIIAAKEEEIRLLKQEIVRHHYNARSQGLSEADLDVPMPPMNVPLEQRSKPGRRTKNSVFRE